MFRQNVIVREDAMKMIEPFIDVHMVKIIAGVRRCGKSYILDMLGDVLLKKGVPQSRIIYRLYTSIEVEAGFTAPDMYKELKARITDGGKYYLLLDEVQEIAGWEKAINTLFESESVDIYVTGSNSRLTSEKISTYLSGRYILLPQYTLSFKEFMKFRGYVERNKDDVYREYIRTGGFPLIAASGISGEQAYQIADGIYHSVITKDILSNHPIRDIEKFNRVVRFIMDNMGRTFSAKSISDYLKSQNREISVETVYNYIEWLEDAFIIYGCNRYDLQGKEILKTQEKYYLSDIALRFALFGYNRSMDDALLENIIYLELRRRGYQVYVGKNGTKEIDFVARHQGEEIHIQATVQLPLGSDREIRNLEEIRDHHHKYVVTTSRDDCEIVNGIRVVHVTDFLLMENW